MAVSPSSVRFQQSCREGNLPSGVYIVMLTHGDNQLELLKPTLGISSNFLFPFFFSESTLALFQDLVVVLTGRLRTLSIKHFGIMRNVTTIGNGPSVWRRWPESVCIFFAVGCNGYQQEGVIRPKSASSAKVSLRSSEEDFLSFTTHCLSVSISRNLNPRP